MATQTDPGQIGTGRAPKGTRPALSDDATGQGPASRRAGTGAGPGGCGTGAGQAA